MGNNLFKSTNTDFRAIADDEFNYLSNKGVNLYIKENYDKVLELINNSIYDDVRNQNNALFDEIYDD